MAISPDGITWTGLGKTIIANTGIGSGFNNKRENQITFPSNLTVAVGQASTPSITTVFSYSLDGINWNAGVNNSTMTIGKIACWNGIKWIATGTTSSNSSIFVNSTDGINWNPNIYTSNTYINDIIWNGNFFVGVGIDNTVNNIYSHNDNFCIAYGSTMKYSNDGILWNPITALGFAVNHVAWNGTLWIAVGRGIAYSSNGINWTINTVAYNLIGAMCNYVVWDYNKWIIGGYDTIYTIYSYDGIIFNYLSGNIRSIMGKIQYMMAYNGNIWICGGQNAGIGNCSIAYSYDSFTWYGTNLSNFGTCTTIAWNSFIWIAGGNNIDITLFANIVYSYDGVTWIPVTNNRNILSNCLSIAWNGLIFVAVGVSAGTSAIASSRDGITWTNLPFTYATTINSITWNGTLWACVLNTGIIRYSYDLITWSLSSGGNTVSGVISKSVLPNIGDNIYTTTYSYDGTIWYPNKSILNSIKNGKSLYYNGTKYVAVGNNTPGVLNTSTVFAYSYDGINWTGGITSPSITTGYTIGWSGSMFVAGGEISSPALDSVFVYSTDGINWNTAMSPNITTCFSLAWNGYLWVAVGRKIAPSDVNYVFAYSYNGINWLSGVNNTNITIARGVTWNGTLWSAIGRNSTGSSTNTVFAYSVDGINWTASSGVTNGSTIGLNVTWNATLPNININSSNSNSTIILNKYGASGTNKLDVVADSFFNKGFTNMTVNFKSTKL